MITLIILIVLYISIVIHSQSCVNIDPAICSVVYDCNPGQYQPTSTPTNQPFSGCGVGGAYCVDCNPGIIITTNTTTTTTTRTAAPTTITKTITKPIATTSISTITSISNDNIYRIIGFYCPGGAVNNNYNSQYICPAGTFSTSAQASCSNCNPGYFSSSTCSSTCSPCNPGTYSTAGLSACLNCKAGSYSSLPAQSICTLCPAGSYSGTQATSCSQCNAGTYSLNGAAECALCPANTYNPNVGSTNSSQCLTCPSSLPIAPPGSSTCQASLDNGSSRNSTILQCKLNSASSKESNAGNIPLYFTIPFGCLGLVIGYIRSRATNTNPSTTSLVSFSILSVSVSTALVGLDLLSDFIYIAFLLNGFFLALTIGTKLLGAIFLIVRLAHPIVTGFIIFSLFDMGSHPCITRFGESFSKSVPKCPKYASLLDFSLWKDNSIVYSVVLTIALSETTMIRYLPWISTEFSKASGGYPDMLAFRLCTYGKLLQNTVCALIQIAVLATLNYGNYSPSCNFILIVSLVSSIIPLIITGFEVMFQAKTLANDNEVIINSAKNTVSNPVLDARGTDIELQSTDINSTKVDTQRRITATDTNSRIASSTDTNSSIASSTGNNIIGSITGNNSIASSTDNNQYTIKLSTRSVSSVEFRQALVRYYTSVAPGTIIVTVIIIVFIITILTLS